MRKIVCIIVLLGCVLFTYADPGYNISYTGATTFCQGGGITLNATGAPAGATFQWTKNTANIAGATSSSFTISNAAVSDGGAYSVVINGGAIHYDTVNIVVNPNPTADFTPSATTICISTPVSFTNTSSGSGLSYSWNFGDPNSGTNNTSTVTNPTHRFIGTPGTTPQTFRVRLTVTSNTGCVSMDSVDITVNQSPGTQLGGTGAITFDGRPFFRQCASTTSNFNFTNQSTTSATNTNYRIIWGDNSPDHNSATFAGVLSHSYPVGTHTLQFIVTGGSGCVDTAVYFVFVGTNPAVGFPNPGNTDFCIGQSITIPITNTSNNSPGTIYNISFSDGFSASYVHPAVPNSVTHVFNNSSCGTNSSDGTTTYTNSFSARIVASNPCGTSSQPVVPIHVSERPVATFTLSPRDTVCVNTSVAFSSTSPANNSVSNGSCIPGRNVWTITPNSGFSLISGTLGNTFGSDDASLWTNGSSNLNVNFTTVGSYTVRLITGNSAQCGLDTAIRTICVNPQPTSAFTIDNNEGCTPVSVATTNSSNTPTCGSNTYVWTVTHSNAQGCTPNASNYTITSGSLTSANPSFQFINPGVYTITLVTRNSNGACVSAPTSRTVTVKSRPNATIAAINPICQNTSATPVATINNCYSTTPATYAWTFQNGIPATATTLNPGAITFNTSGTQNITLDVTNECGVTQAVRTIQVNPRPDLVVPSNLVLCPGEPTGALTFTSALAGTTFSWSNSNTSIGLGPNGSGNIPTFNVSNSGNTVLTSTITVTASNGGCSTIATFTITVNPRPAAPAVTSTVSYCQNATASALTATATAGNTLLWYTTASGGVGSATAPTPSTTTVGTTNYYVSQINTTTNCESPRSSIAVTINESPVIGSAAPGNPNSCNSSTGSIVLSGLTPGSGYTVRYVRNGGATVTLNNQTATGGNITISSLQSGTYTSITVTRNGCTSNIMGPVVLSDPNPPATPTITTNATSPLCSGSQLTFTANTTSGTATYNWGGPNGFASTQQNPTLNNATSAASGTYTVTATISGCTSMPGQVTVTIDSTPAVPTVTSNSPVCTGNVLNLTANSATAGVSYTWTGPGTFTSNVQNPTINNVATTEAGTYMVTATLGNCTSTNQTTVAVNPTPVIGGSNSTNPTNCATSTGTITLTGLIAGTYTVSYVRNGGAPIVVNNLTANASGEITMTGLSAGAYTNIFVTRSGCNSSPLAATITLSDPTPPVTPAITSNAPLCSGGTLTLEANTTSGAATYSWNGPNGFTANTAAPTIANVTTAASGTYNVTATINGCTSPTATINITVNPTPATPSAGSNSPLCTGNTLNLASASTTAGVSYSWAGPNTFSSTSQNPSRANVTTADAGNYIVTATLGACTSTNSTTVAINTTPAIGGSSSTNPTNCATATGTITLTGLTANASYTVSYVKDGGAPNVLTNVAANASGEITITALGAGAYTNIFVTSNGCSSAPLATAITLSDPTPPATPTIITNAPICSGSTLTLEAGTTSAGVATFAWGGPNGFTSNIFNPTITNVTTAASGNYTVTATINGCTSPAGSINITINPTPAIPTVGSNTPVCTGNTLNLTSASATAGVSYAWTGPNTFSSTLQNPTRANVVVADAGLYTVTATLGSCSSQNSTTVTINPTPAIAGHSSTNPTNCATSTGTITLTGLTASANYTVSYVRNGAAPTVLNNVAANATGEVTITALSAGVYTNIFVTLNGCNSAPLAATITLSDPTPPSAPVATTNAPVCSGNTLELYATSASTGIITYTWSGPNTFISTSQNPTISSVTSAANGTYNVTATLNSCVSPAGSVTVVINETPATPVANNNGPVCADSTLNLTASTTFAGAVSWSWTGPNTFASNLQNPAIAGATVAANGTYNVIATATTGNCPSVPGSTTVVVNPTPVISSSSFTNPILCLSSTGTIVLNGLTPSTAYTVTYTRNTAPVTATITSEGTGSLIIPLLSAGTYADVRVTTLAGCPSNPVGPFVLTDPNPPAAPTAGSNSPICTGETLTLTANTVTPGAITYTWNGPAGFTSNVQNPSIINAAPANSGTYTVTATLNNCVSPATPVLVDVTALPSPPTVTSPVNYCIDATPVPLTATTVPGNSLRWYTTAVGGTGSATAPTPATNVTGVTTYYVSQVTALGCEGTRASIDVIVNPDALAEYVSSPAIDCAPFNINASVLQPVLHPTRNNAYNWYANGVLIGSGTTFPGYTITQPGDSIFIKLVSTSLFGCKSDSAARWFYTFPVPVTDFTASDTVGCGPLSVTFTNNTPDPGSFNFNWNFGNGITSAAQDPGTIVFQPNPTAGDTVYNVSLAAYTQCDTIIKVVPIRVKSKPQAIFTPDKTYGCSPLTVVFTNISLGVNMTFEWNFGDGSPSFFTNNTSSVSHTFNTAQQDTFHVRLIATNDCGSDTGYYNVVVAARTINLDVAVNGNQVTGCAPHAVRFFNNSTGATNFVWDLGDGNLLTTTPNIDTVDHTYLTTGTFNVSIRASNGCTDTTIYETISVFAKPLVNFSAFPSPVCIGDTVFFTNQTDTITGLLWNFGDGITSQLTNPVHAYQIPGTYDVKLIGIRQYAPGNACTDSITKQITVVATLPGSFTVSDSVGNCMPFAVTFTNQTYPSALTTWNFGNGAVDTGNVVNYTFNQPGTFIVTMTVRHPDGCTYTGTKQIIVNGPTGSFTYDNGFICGNTPVRFESNTTGTDSVRWNFGDGAFLTTTSNVVYHLYQQSGVYIPSAELISGTNGNCRRVLIGGDTIRVDYVSAGFTSTQLRLCGSTTVNFNDTSRSYFPMQSWQWIFGDGNNSVVRHPNHTYTSTNTWPIQLIATSTSGCADTTIVPVFVKVDVKPEASIVHDPVGCVNQPVTYNSVVISPDPVTYYSWTFSNLASGNTATVTNNYAAPGIYAAQLITGTSFGCYDTVTSNITINPSPFVNTSPDMIICRGESAQITTTGGLSYTWAPFTGLSCNDCPNPIASPITTTRYVVTGFNSFGCAARDTILITVPQPIDIAVTANTTMCIGDTVQLNATGAASYIWSPANTLNNANIPNPVATPPATTVYRVIGFDGNSCFQDTAYVTVGVGNYPVVNVGIDRLVATGTLINLTPTATNGPIAIWNWAPPTDLSCATCPSPIAIAKKEICYTVTATNFFGCSGSDTMCIRVFCESSQVFIPNAFTPDADGINDVLVVKAQGVKAVKSFRVFNRWGQLVFEKSNFQPNIESFGWDGKVKGVAAPPDVYVYTCEVLCENDVPYTYKGNVAILK